MTSTSKLAHRKNSVAEGNFGIDPDHQAAYSAGRSLRRDDRDKSHCHNIDPVRQAWILAGWHDADIEAGNSVLKGPTQ